MDYIGKYDMNYIDKYNKYVYKINRLVNKQSGGKNVIWKFVNIL